MKSVLAMMGELGDCLGAAQALRALLFSIVYHDPRIVTDSRGSQWPHKSIWPLAKGHPPCFPDGSDSKASACNAGDLGLIPGSGRSPGEGNGNPLQHSCLENPMDRGA